jgi:hypothetical protein
VAQICPSNPYVVDKHTSLSTHVNSGVSGSDGSSSSSGVYGSVGSVGSGYGSGAGSSGGVVQRLGLQEQGLQVHGQQSLTCYCDSRLSGFTHAPTEVAHWEARKSLEVWRQASLSESSL